MQENLRYDVGGLGRWYNNDENLLNVYSGRLYTYEEVLNGDTPGGGQVQGICPDGWHLPSAEDIGTLIDALGGNTQAATNLRYPSPSFWSSASLPSVGTFNMVGSGFYYPWHDFFGSFSAAFGDQFERSGFWTSSTETAQDGNDYAVALYLTSGESSGVGGVSRFSTGVGSFTTIENYDMPCRCIKD